MTSRARLCPSRILAVTSSALPAVATGTYFLAWSALVYGLALSTLHLIGRMSETSRADPSIELTKVFVGGSRSMNPNRRTLS